MMRGTVPILIMVVCLMLLGTPYMLSSHEHQARHANFDSSPEGELKMPDDPDGDGLATDLEYELGTDPFDSDTDDDNWIDGIEYQYWKNRHIQEKNRSTLQWIIDAHGEEADYQSEYSPKGDLDADGLSNILDKDSDSDDVVDGSEIETGFDPAFPESDHSSSGGGVDRLDPGTLNHEQTAKILGHMTGSSSGDSPIDSDGDGMPDWFEDMYGISDVNGDPDGDNLTNGQEFLKGTNPLVPDATGPSGQPYGSSSSNDNSLVLCMKELGLYDTFAHNKPEEGMYLRSNVYDTVATSDTTYPYQTSSWGGDRHVSYTWYLSNRHGYINYDWGHPIESNSLGDVERSFLVVAPGGVRDRLPLGYWPRSVYNPSDTDSTAILNDCCEIITSDCLKFYCFSERSSIHRLFPDGLNGTEKTTDKGYLNLPSQYSSYSDSVDDDVVNLVADITHRCDDDPGRVAAIMEFLWENGMYDMDSTVSWTHSSNILREMFLDGEPIGTCSDFATAFIIMCRMCNISARYVSGFYADTFVNGTLLVFAGNAHAWGEVFLNGVGWVPLDPTPTRLAPGGTYFKPDLLNATFASPVPLNSIPGYGQVGSSGLGMSAGTNLSDIDRDGIPDASDEDIDGDGIPNTAEKRIGTSPYLWDTDGDSLGDGQERDIGTSPTSIDTDGGSVPDGLEIILSRDPTDPRDDPSASTDTDGDGLSNAIEKGITGTSPYQADTDHDGEPDSSEVIPMINSIGMGDNELYQSDLPGGFSMDFFTDRDGDGLPLALETQLGTNDYSTDTDWDGLSDLDELYYGSDPNNRDTDGDGLDDKREVIRGTDPRSVDTDGDGLSDYDEVQHHSNPNAFDTDLDSRPDGEDPDITSTTDWEEWRDGAPSTSDDKKTGDRDSEHNDDDDPVNNEKTPKHTPPDDPDPPPLRNDPPKVNNGGAFLIVIVLLTVMIMMAAMFFMFHRRNIIKETKQVMTRASSRMENLDPFANSYDREVRMEIFRVYKQMLNIMLRHGYTRYSWMTPREFEYVLIKALPLSRSNISSLTRIFEEARYSKHHISRDLARRAVDCFERIKLQLDYDKVKTEGVTAVHATA